MASLGYGRCPLTSQYADMNRAAFNTRRTSSKVPPGATRGSKVEPDAPRTHVCGWDASGPAPLSLDERIALVRQRVAEQAAARRAHGFSAAARIVAAPR